jgi:SAM-dependent methyltransferase
MFKHKVFDSACFRGKKILDIGCGRDKLPGSVGLDHMPLPGVDVVCDLSESLPFEDGEFEVVYSNQVLEHVPNMIDLIEEIHRILVPGGLLVAHVPYFRSSWAAVDPTHIRNFTLSSLDYFVEGTLAHEGYRFSDVSFLKMERFLDSNYPPSVFRWLFTRLALRWPNSFENSALSFVYPFQTLSFVLTK